MEELFDTIAWETSAPASSNAKPSRDPLWARLCGYAGAALLVVAGLGFVALGVMLEVQP